MSLPEPWLRGAFPEVHPMLAPVLCSFQHAREDLARHTEGLGEEQIWARPHGLTPLGYHLKHIAGSVDRLLTYLQGGQLNVEQTTTLEDERQAGGDRRTLLAALDAALRKAEAVVRTIDPNTLSEPRAVGRKKLPTTVIGLLVHIAEHTQRHVGQAVTTAKLLR